VTAAALLPDFALPRAVVVFLLTGFIVALFLPCGGVACAARNVRMARQSPQRRAVPRAMKNANALDARRFFNSESMPGDDDSD